MKREEIQKRSAEKQRRILDYMEKAGKPVSIKAVQEELGLDYKDARNQFGNLRVKNAIECAGRIGNEYVYTIQTGNTESYKEKVVKRMNTMAITPEAIRKAREKVCVGDRYYYRDEEGTRKSTKVSDTRYLFICLFDNGQAYSWADVIRCHRRGGRTLGEWER